MDIISKNINEIRREFDNYVKDLRKEHDSDKTQKSVGEVMLEIWNAWCENKANEFDAILDLKNEKDFKTFVYEFKDLIYENKDIEVFKQRYVYIDYNFGVGDNKESYRYLTEDELVNWVRTELETIIEYALAFPTSYPVWFYQSVVWPILRNENIVTSFDLH